MGKIAIVGKPNVGKSTLFNALIGKNKSLVLNIPGTTRDRIFGYGKLKDKDVLFIDTGGFERGDELSEHINEQVKFAIDSSDAVIVVFDATTPVSVQDEEIYRYVVKSSKPFVAVLNKSDVKNREFAYEYFKFGDLLEISASHRRSIDILKEKLSGFVASEPRGEFEARIAIVGRSNVGKSSLVNAILRQDRSIVNDRVGTTTDSVDTPFSYKGKNYLIVDTAGIRKRSKKLDSLEKLSSIFSIFSIDRADVAVLVIDAKEGLTSMDKQIGSLIVQKHKGVVIALNKWDLVEDPENFSKYARFVHAQMPYLEFASVVPVSAKKAQNIGKLLHQIEVAVSSCRMRIPTHRLNVDLHKIIRANAPFSRRGKEVKLKYMTQVGVNPPHFVIFTNRPEEIEENYSRYVKNSLYRLYGFKNCAIKLTFRSDKNGELRGDNKENKGTLP